MTRRKGVWLHKTAKPWFLMAIFVPRRKQRNGQIEAVSTASGSRFAGASSGIRSLARKSSWHRDKKLVAGSREYWYLLMSARITLALTSVTHFKFGKC